MDWHTSSTDNTQPDREPTLGDYVEFFKLFNKYDFKTEDGVKQFLKDFHFEDIFVFEDGKSVEWNMNCFGWLLRSLIPINFPAVEGQHRLWLLSGFLQGLSEATTVLPLKFIRVDQLDDKLKEKRDQWQIWHKKMVFFMVPNDDIPKMSNMLFIEMLDELKRCSKELHRGAQRCISHSAETLLSQWCMEIHQNWAAWGLKSVSYENFWSDKVHVEDTVVINNAMIIWTKLADELKTESEKLSIFMKAGEAHKFPAVKNAMSARLKKHWTFVTKNIQGTWPTELATIMGIFKFISFDRRNFMLLAWVLSFVKKERQRENGTRGVDMNVLGNMLRAAERGTEHIAERLLVDRKVIQLVTKMEALREYNRKTIPAEKLPTTGSSPATKWVFPDETKSLDKDNIGVRSNNFQKKVIQATMCCIVPDMLVALKELGMNPIIFSEDDIKNATVMPEEFYRKMSEKPENKNWVLKNYFSEEKKYWNHFKWQELLSDRENGMHVGDIRDQGVVAVSPMASAMKNNEKYSMNMLYSMFPYFQRLRSRLHLPKVMILKKVQPMQFRNKTWAYPMPAEKVNGECLKYFWNIWDNCCGIMSMECDSNTIALISTHQASMRDSRTISLMKRFSVVIGWT